MSKKYEKLKTLLKELFQLDQPDLDFGLYRIMHAKSAEITQFLDRELLPQVREEFAKYKTADKSDLESQLAKVIAGLQAAEVDPETSPKVRELREKIASDSVDLAGLESEVYDHLYGFFRRYYSEGDFLSKRVYKPGVYAIPYEGEEVKLHWANADQYYIKTSEYLRDYAFRLHPDDEQKPMRVHFRLVDAAEGEHGNVKAAEGKDRIFILASKDFAAIKQGEQGPELTLQFEYRPATLTDWPDDVRNGKKKPPTQKDMTELAVSRIMAAGGEFANWIAELGKSHEKSDGELADYSRLMWQLDCWIKRGTWDYFIHKDLSGFLRRELDFYIKNEVMHLDDIEGQQAPRVEQYLSKVRVIRRIATKIITFLAHLEDFQKKLWLKKKFVVETNYCVTVSSIPEEFYPEIAGNDAQRREWVEMLAINEIQKDLTSPGYSEPLTVAFLKAHPTLVVDTRHFDEGFCSRLLHSVQEVNTLTDGVVFHGENFQALAMMQGAYRHKIKSVYIDPPYNTDASPIIYKNGYRHSSWSTLIADRLNIDSLLRKEESMLCVAIDDFEYHHLQCVLDTLFAGEHLATAVVRSKPQGRPTTAGFSANHEYAVFWGSKGSQVGRLPRSGSKAERYPHSDDKGIFAWANFRKSGTDSDRADRRWSYYPVYVSEAGVRIPEMVRNKDTESWDILDKPREGETEVYPIDSSKIEKVWTCSPERAHKEIDDIRFERGVDGTIEIYKKYRPNQDGALPGTWWDDAGYSASESGTKVLKDLFGAKDFDYPKSINLVVDCLRVLGLTPGEMVLDYFGGSGTTAHAVMHLNREEGGRRKFAIVEMGDYAETVLLPRIKKITFTPEWKDGRPSRHATQEEGLRGPRIVKYLRLESYEDTLNNLQLRRSKAQQTLLEAAQNTEASRLKEQYMLGYMLNVEAEGSQSLLNVRAFTDPTSYKLKVKRPGSDESREVNVDLLETFNWLIGLTVQHIAAPQRFSAKFERDGEGRLQLKGRLKQHDEGDYWFRTVTGATPDGRKTLVIWRKRPGGETPEGVEQDNLILDEWFTKQGYSSKDSEFGVIYVNGTNNLENLRTPEDLWKVRLIEEDFHRLMFAAEGV